MKSPLFYHLSTLLLLSFNINCYAAGHPQPQQQMPSGMPVHNVAPGPQAVPHPQAMTHPHNFTHSPAPVGNNSQPAANNNWHPNPAANNNHPMNNNNHPTNNNGNHNHHHFNQNNNGYYFYNNVAVPYYVAPAEDEDDSYVQPEDEDNDNANNNDQANLTGNAWASANDGQVPQNAVSYQDGNGATVYYCRTLYNSTEYYGYLVSGDGCYVDDQSTTLRFEQYEVLVQN